MNQKSSQKKRFVTSHRPEVILCVYVCLYVAMTSAAPALTLRQYKVLNAFHHVSAFPSDIPHTQKTTFACTCRSPRMHQWEQGSVGEPSAVTDTQ